MQVQGEHPAHALPSGSDCAFPPANALVCPVVRPVAIPVDPSGTKEACTAKLRDRASNKKAGGVLATIAEAATTAASLACVSTIVLGGANLLIVVLHSSGVRFFELSHSA